MYRYQGMYISLSFIVQLSTQIISIRTIFPPPSPIIFMESEPLSETSSGESEMPPSPTILPAGKGFAITTQDANILKGYIEDFQKADTETRKAILEKVMGELYTLRPLNSAFDKKEVKQVFVLTIHVWVHWQYIYHRKLEHGFTIIILALTASLSSSPGSGQPAMRFTMRTRQRSCNLLRRCPEVLLDLRHSWVPSRMQPQVYGRSYLVKNRSSMQKLQRNGQRIDLRGISKPSPWLFLHLFSISIIHPSRMAQAAFRGRIIRDFQTQLFRTCGMRSIVLVAYEDKDGNARAAMYAFQHYIPFDVHTYFQGWLEQSPG
jgi:hypothetical protein